MARGYGRNFEGHEKEPKSAHGKRHGKHPTVHSHSARPHSKVMPKSSGRKAI